MSTDQRLDRLTDLIAAARKLGADAADAIFVESASLGVSYRMGKLEDVERSESLDIGLRVFLGKRQAVSSTTDLRAPSLKALAERVVGMARTAPEDPYCGLADPARLARSFPALDLEDPVDPGAEVLKARAAAAEGAALAVPGITNWKARARAGAVRRSRWRPRRASRGAMAAPATAFRSACWRAKAPAWSATTISCPRAMAAISAIRPRPGARRRRGR